MTDALSSFDPTHVQQNRVLTHDHQFVCCRFSHDGKQLFSAGFDGRLHRWNLDNDQRDAFDAHQGWVESMQLSPGGDKLFTADSWGQVHGWPTAGETLQPLWTIPQAHAFWLRGLTISPDGSQLATCGADKMVRVFSSLDGKLVKELAGHEHCVQSVTFHRHGHGLVSGDQHGVVKHWDIATGQCKRNLDASKLFKKFHQYDQGGVFSMTFDPEGQTLYCAGFEGRTANQADGTPTVVVLDWENGQPQDLITPSQTYKGPILDLLFHPAGYLIGAGSSEAGGVLWFWKPGQQGEAHLVKNVTSFRQITLRPDGRQLAATAFGDTVGQRGGNGRRLNENGEYLGFAGNIVIYTTAQLSES